MTLDELKNEPRDVKKLLTAGAVQQAKRGRPSRLRPGHMILVESEDAPGKVEYKILTTDGALVDPWDWFPDTHLGAVED